MKKIILSLLIFGCNSKTPADSPQLAKAKDVMKKFINTIEYADIGAIPQHRADSLAKALNTQIEELKQQLTTIDADSLEAYRVRILSAMIERKVNRNERK